MRLAGRTKPCHSQVATSARDGVPHAMSEVSTVPLASPWLSGRAARWWNDRREPRHRCE